MDTLPEELLSQITSHIHSHTPSSPPGPHTYPSTSTLYALCLTSRKLFRIATPFLYTRIHSTSGAMGKSLYRTLLAESTLLTDSTSDSTKRRSLCSYTREFSVQHALGGGCQDISPDHSDDVLHADFGKTFDVCQMYLQRTIALLPHLSLLDLSRFPPPNEGRNVWLCALRDACVAAGEGEDWAKGTGWENVRRLALHLGGASGEAVGVVFRLPRLRELEVDVRRAGGGWGSEEDGDLWPVGSSGVEVLRVVGLQDGVGRVNDLVRMSEACRALRSVFVAVSQMSVVRFVPHIFKQHVERGVLERLQIVVDGLWEYEICFTSAKLFGEGPSLGEEMMALMIHATGHLGMEEKDCYESERVKITSMRELGAGEKKAYDMRLARRP